MGRIRYTIPRVNASGQKSGLGRLLLAAVIVLVVGIGIFFWHSTSGTSPVMTDVRKAVSFPIYYPEQAKLPPGYNLDTNSFRLAQEGVVVYSVQKGNQQLVFSEEATPESGVIDKFNSSYIPLHNTIATGLGKATFGAAGQGAHLQTIVSLPITKGPWLIITAPANTKQSDMRQILDSLAT